MPIQRARLPPIHPQSTSLCPITQTSVQAGGEQDGRIVKVERRGRRRARPARLGWARAGKANGRIHDSCRDTSSFQSGRTLKALPHFVQGAHATVVGALPPSLAFGRGAPQEYFLPHWHSVGARGVRERCLPFAACGSVCTPSLTMTRCQRSAPPPCRNGRLLSTPS